MSDAYRTHYLPAACQLLPGADPYIASLVLPMFQGAKTLSRNRLERHSQALSDGCEFHPTSPHATPPVRDRRCAPKQMALAARGRREALITA
jgi:hypothetical protein